jgi:hypothetical protein
MSFAAIPAAPGQVHVSICVGLACPVSFPLATSQRRGSSLPHHGTAPAVVIELPRVVHRRVAGSVGSACAFLGTWPNGKAPGCKPEVAHATRFDSSGAHFPRSSSGRTPAVTPETAVRICPEVPGVMAHGDRVTRGEVGAL